MITVKKWIKNATAVTLITPPPKTFYLRIREGYNGIILYLDDIPEENSVPITRDAFFVFQLYMFNLYRLLKNKTPPLTIAQPFKINDILNEILFFLYADIARLVVPNPALSNHDKLERTAIALFSSPVTISRITSTSGQHFFTVLAAEKAALFSYALNGNLDAVINTVRFTHPKKLHVLLSRKLTLTPNHLKKYAICRTGTPLQMALYGDDEQMIAYFKSIMNANLFEHQLINILQKVLPVSVVSELRYQNATLGVYYETLQEVQKMEAAILCLGIKEAFIKALSQPECFDLQEKFLATTTSVDLQKTVGEFFQNVLDYVKHCPIHNPYILLELYKIYIALLSETKDVKGHCFFGQKVIGYVQSLLPARWLQHFAQEMNRIVDYKEDLKRSFILRLPSQIDIRDYLSSLGDPYFLHVFSYSGVISSMCEDGLVFPTYEGFLKMKEAKFLEAIHPVGGLLSACAIS